MPYLCQHPLPLMFSTSCLILLSPATLCHICCQRLHHHHHQLPKVCLLYSSLCTFPLSFLTAIFYSPNHSLALASILLLPNDFIRHHQRLSHNFVTCCSP